MITQLPRKGKKKKSALVAFCLCVAPTVRTITSSNLGINLLKKENVSYLFALTVKGNRESKMLADYDEMVN